MKVFKIFFLFAFSCFFMPACGTRPVVKERAFLMGTVVDIVIHDADRNAAELAARLAFSEAERLEKLLSAYDPDSEVSLVNLNAGSGGVRVSDETFFVIERAVEYGHISGGAFDITVMPLLELWGFRDRDFRFPEEERLKETLELVDFSRIFLDPETNTVGLPDKGMGIDLGGIAKGYVVDMMVSVLRESGVSGALVNAGGDIYALGSSHWQPGWRVGIRHPRKDGKVADVVELKDGAVATSGDYEKYFMHEGRRLSHVFDPRSGMPSEGMMSVTVIASSAMEADALSTMLFVLGEEKGAGIAEELGAEAVFFPEEPRRE